MSSTNENAGRQPGAGKSNNTTARFYPNPSTVRGRILGALLRQDKLTQHDALLRFSNFRLAADVDQLKRYGWSIQTELIQVSTRDAGRRAEVGQYHMPNEAIAEAGERGQQYAAECARIEAERRAA